MTLMVSRGPHVVEMTPRGWPQRLIGEGPYDAGEGRRILDVVRVSEGDDGKEPALPAGWLVRVEMVGVYPAYSDEKGEPHATYPHGCVTRMRRGVFRIDNEGRLVSVAYSEGDASADDDRQWEDRKWPTKKKGRRS